MLGQPGPRRYVYLCLGKAPAPYAYLTRDPTGKEVARYGPLVGRDRAADAVRRLNDWFRLRDCPSTVPMPFIRQVVPVAEELGIRIGIHPDDPPVPELGGVPRCIFGNFDGYVRALEIANSPNVGVCLCCGTWMEGGKGMGKDVFEAIRAFAKMGKLWKIHFRNVSAPVPHFVETFVDDGYGDMYAIMRTLQEVGFRGVAIPDHIPQMGDDPRLGTAYTIGYMKALLERARAEVG